VCIPPPPPILTCADIPYRNFRVVAPDPDDFDPDHNGIGCPTGTDWSTYGFDPSRSGQNTAETALGAGNAAGLHAIWSAHLGGVIVGQPTVAAGVVIGGQTRDVIYVGDESGHFDAIDEHTGAILWHDTLPTVTIAGCTDVQNGVFGIGGAGLLDRKTNTVYIAASDGAVHAYDLVTGAEHAGWPVTGVFNPNQTTSYGGITTDSGGTALYVQAASHCDFRPYHGSLTKIDVARHAISAVFEPAGQFDGGGIWGPGGASYDAASHHLFVATGNAFTTPESFGYSEQVVELDGNLNVVGANYPGLTGLDVDFGATPIVYQAPGCPVQVAAENKSGVLVVYDQGHLGNGPVQRIQMADVTDETFVGIPAYSAATHMLYVANSSDSAPYTRGMVAFSVGSNCQLTKVWNDTLGPNKTPESPPTIANGVVYFGDGFGATEYAINAATGAVLWNSGTQLDDSVYAAPTVVNGTLLVGTWNGTLYAFGP
jgi:outer membrane protein assembly factor BamB